MHANEHLDGRAARIQGLYDRYRKAKKYPALGARAGSQCMTCTVCFGGDQYTEKDAPIPAAGWTVHFLTVLLR